MGSSQSSLGWNSHAEYMHSSSGQLKCEMRRVKTYQDLQAENKGLKAELASANAELQKLATQAKLQT